MTDKVNNMYVYVVMDGTPAGDSLRAVFADKQAALKYCHRVNENWHVLDPRSTYVVKRKMR